MRIEYPDGPPQRAQVLVLHAAAYWLATIDASRVREEVRPDILMYQKKAVDALYVWAQSSRALPAPYGEEPARVTEPRASAIQTEPGRVLVAPMQPPKAGAGHAELAAYHENMALWHRYQADRHTQQWRDEVEEWRGSVEARLEGDHELLTLIPEVLERLGPPTVTAQQQTNIRGMVKRLAEATGTPYQTIYWELAQAFQAPRYDEILESHYPAIAEWFRRRIEQARKPRGKS